MTRIEYAIPSACKVALRVYDVRGRLVRQLRSGAAQPGVYRAEWDGKNAEGHDVAGGIYFIRLSAGAGRMSRKVVLIR
jgi:flagellar hook assembly protein FlgD